MQCLVLPPNPALALLVTSYWFVEDLADLNCGRPIHTAPHVHAVLTVHLGRPNIDERAVSVPRVSLLGVQSRGRTWGSLGDCCFVMVMLNLAGLVRLFPHTGPDSEDRLNDLGAILGDRAAGQLGDDLAAAGTPHRIAERLDAWLLGRLAAAEPVSEFGRFSTAWRALQRTGQIGAAAQAAEVSPRQLERWFRAHVGRTPKDLVCQERVMMSLHAAQTGAGDALVGFSDQAHQIRSWRRYLGETPGRYTWRSAAELAGLHQRAVAAAGFAFYL